MLCWENCLQTPLHPHHNLVKFVTIRIVHTGTLKHRKVKQFAHGPMTGEYCLPDLQTWGCLLSGHDSPFPKSSREKCPREYVLTLQGFLIKLALQGSVKPSSTRLSVTGPREMVLFPWG